ncbi:MAG: hypothetical protein OK457_08425 [Thaumarchaeota archaeon]|nr:hypothetical protein [Nitrososphaerota archaeon]
MESIYLREAREGDLPAMPEIYNEALVTSTATFERDPQTIENKRKWFSKHGSRYR